MARSILVYDGSNTLFRAAAETVERHSETLTLVPWESEPVQAFLEAQFGESPFAFILIDDDTVHVGDESVARVLSEQGVAQS